VPSWKTIDRYVVVSSDAHAGAPITGYRPYLAPRWRDEFDAWAAAVVNPWHDVNDATNWDSDARLAAMDADGVSGELIFPNTLPPFYDVMTHLSGVPRDRETFERRWAGLQAHNRWIVEFCAAAPERRRAVVQLLPNDLDAAVAELRWAAEQRVVGGVMLPAVPPNHEVAPYYDRRYDPLWEAAVEVGLPVHQHQGSGNPDPAPGSDAGESVRFVDNELWTRLTMSHLIVGGVFERHPELKVVWTEMFGLRWALDDLERMTRGLRTVQSRHAGDPHQLNFHHTFGSPTTEGLRLTPMEYFGRNCYIGASLVSSFDVPYLRPLGLDRVMWGHDAPHPEGSDGHTTEALRSLFHDLSPDECRQVLTTNAAELYHFDLDVLTPVAERIGPRIDDVRRPLDDTPDSTGSAFWEPNPVRAVLEGAASVG
jgi:predicted TIM-barrel fold metal-dependent hydrolase